jgi:hypothetical protein
MQFSEHNPFIKQHMTDYNSQWRSLDHKELRWERDNFYIELNINNMVLQYITLSLKIATQV